MEFKGLKANIAAFQKSAPLLVEKMAEDWYKDNIRLGGEQKSSGMVKPFTLRKHKYSHPMLIETGQLLNSIKAIYNRAEIKVSHKVNNYRGNRDYAEIHNKLGTPTKIGGKIQLIKRPFMADSKGLTNKMEHKIVVMLKKIFT